MRLGEDAGVDVLLAVRHLEMLLEFPLGHELREHVLLAAAQHKRGQQPPRAHELRRLGARCGAIVGRRRGGHHLEGGRELRREGGRQHEAKEGEELRQSILHRGSGEEEPLPRVDPPQPRVALRLLLAQRVGFVKHEQPPPPPPEPLAIEAGGGMVALKVAVGSQHHIGAKAVAVVVVARHLELALHLAPLLLRAVVAHGH